MDKRENVEEAIEVVHKAANQALDEASQVAALARTYKDVVMDYSKSLYDKKFGEVTATGKARPISQQAETASGLSKDDLIKFADRLRSIIGESVHDDFVCVEALTAYALASFDGYAKAGDDAQNVIEDSRPQLHDIRALEGKPIEEKRAYLKKYSLDVNARLKSIRKVHDELNEMTSRAAVGTYVAAPDGQIGAIALSRWAANGYPQIVMGHKYAASLMLTNIGSDTLEYVKPPWDGFLIEVPNGLLEIWHPEKESFVPIQRIIVSQHANKHLDGNKGWMYLALTDTSVSIWRFGVSTADLLPPRIEGDNMESNEDVTMLEILEEDRRVTTLIGRLIVNTCLAMSDPENVKKQGPGHASYERTSKKRESPEPIVRTFQIGQPVRHDFRDRIRDFIRHGTRKGMSVQTLVCGHFKMQPHGPKSSLRKLIWRQPFWRGPEDAPIVVRPHVILKEDSKS